MTAAQLEHRLNKRVALFEKKLEIDMVRLNLMSFNPFRDLIINGMKLKMLFAEIGMIQAQPLPQFERGGDIKEAGPELIVKP